MIYKGLVSRIDNDLFLFIHDPEKNIMKDGFIISDHVCYKELKKDQIMTVEVLFKDGTLELDDIDLDEFIHGTNYGRNDIFINIKDILLFTLNVDLKKEIKKGNFNDIAHDLFNYDVNEDSLDKYKIKNT